MTALVIGGSKGIGRAIALGLTAAGKKIYINYSRDDDAARATAAEIGQRGGEAILLKADVGDPNAIGKMMTRIAEQSAGLDQLIHSSVFPIARQALEINHAEFTRAVAVNGSSLLFAVQAARPLLRRDSSVTFLSSYGSKSVIRGYVALGAPKALAEAIVRYLAVELAPDGIRVNIVTPSAMPTDAVHQLTRNFPKVFELQAKATPMGRNPTFDDVVSAVTFLASPAAAMITGQELVVDGGLRLRA